MFSKDASASSLSSLNKPRSIAFQLILLFTLAAAPFARLRTWHLLLDCRAPCVCRRQRSSGRQNVRLKRGSARERTRNFCEEVTAHRAGQHTPYWIRILDSQGRAIAETPEMDRLIPTQIFPVAREPAEAIRTRKDYRSAGKLFSLVSFNEHSGARLTHFSWHKTAQVTSKLKETLLCYSSRSSSAALWPRL